VLSAEVVVPPAAALSTRVGFIFKSAVDDGFTNLDVSVVVVDNSASCCSLSFVVTKVYPNCSAPYLIVLFFFYKKLLCACE